jgi:molybdopterin synthase sulfur carrier subunit
VHLDPISRPVYNYPRNPTGILCALGNESALPARSKRAAQRLTVASSSGTAAESGALGQMAISVIIPSMLRRFTGGAGEIQGDGASVRELLDSVVAKHEGLRERLFTASNRIQPHINVFVNEQNIRQLSGPDTALADGDRVSIVPVIAGG